MYVTGDGSGTRSVSKLGRGFETSVGPEMRALSGKLPTLTVKEPRDRIDGSLSIETSTWNSYVEDAFSLRFGMASCACGFRYLASTTEGPDSWVHANTIASFATGQLENTASARISTGSLV